MAIRRPPFDFEISKELENAINMLADAIEAGNYIEQVAWEQEIWAERRELKEGSPEEDWVLSYYYERGWMHEQDN